MVCLEHQVMDQPKKSKKADKSKSQENIAKHQNTKAEEIGTLKSKKSVTNATNEVQSDQLKGIRQERGAKVQKTKKHKDKQRTGASDLVDAHNNSQEKSTSPPQQELSESNAEKPTKSKKSKKRKKRESSQLADCLDVQIVHQEETSEQTFSECVEESIKPKKSKKRKRKSLELINCPDSVQETPATFPKQAKLCSESRTEQIVASKISKKPKKEPPGITNCLDVSQDTSVQPCSEEVAPESGKSKRIKKRKKAEPSEPVSHQQVIKDTVIIADENAFGRKKKSTKESTSEMPAKSKKRKRKNVNEDSEQVKVDVQMPAKKEKQKLKKKRKNSATEVFEDLSSYPTVQQADQALTSSSAEEKDTASSGCKKKLKKKKCKKTNKSDVSMDMQQTLDQIESSLDTANKRSKTKKKKSKVSVNLVGPSDSIEKDSASTHKEEASPEVEKEKKQTQFKNIQGDRLKDTPSTDSDLGQWQTAQLSSSAHEKFARLLGARKNSRKVFSPLVNLKAGESVLSKLTGVWQPPPERKLFGSLQNGDKKFSKMAMGVKETAMLNDSLETQYKKTLEFNLQKRKEGNKAKGLGFQEDPAKGKKHYIDINKVKSTTLD